MAKSDPQGLTQSLERPICPHSLWPIRSNASLSDDIYFNIQSLERQKGTNALKVGFETLLPFKT